MTVSRHLPHPPRRKLCVSLDASSRAQFQRALSHDLTLETPITRTNPLDPRGGRSLVCPADLLSSRSNRWVFPSGLFVSAQELRGTRLIVRTELSSGGALRGGAYTQARRGGLQRGGMVFGKKVQFFNLSSIIACYSCLVRKTGGDPHDDQCDETIRIEIPDR